MLKEGDFKFFYNSGADEPSNFLFEGLVNSTKFDLGLGYFRSSGFKCTALGFAQFLKQGGRMRFIINDSLAEKDKAAILKGVEETTDEEYEEELMRDISNLNRTLAKRDQHFFDCLSWLISSERLEMIAVVPRKNKVGIVHHKFGVFTDTVGDQSAFNGSLNFSQYALQYNVESIWCEYSWHGDIGRRRIDEMKRLFEDTWNGHSLVVRKIPLEKVKAAIYDRFPKKPLKELVEMECELATEISSFHGTSEESREKLQQIVDRLNRVQEPAYAEPTPNKWKHQDEAVKVFLKNERGVLNMATGTGKTRTALRICKTLQNSNEIDSLIVSCDGTDLLEQWYKELLKLAKDLGWLICRHYDSNHQSERFRNNPLKKIMLSSRQQLPLAMNGLTNNLANRTLIIHDEVHKLGSAGNRKNLGGLSDAIRYRLGLSATPEREYDEDGSQFILEHIGQVIFSFTLEDGIRNGILSPFHYFPVPYELTAADRTRLQSVHKRKAMREKEGNPMSMEDFRNELARVYKTAEGKIPAFRDFIKHHSEMLDRCIVFVETKEFAEPILDIIHRHHTDFHTYYGGEDSAVLARFAHGEIECLLTCHRLSEGIDIQSLKNVILISSSRTRLETIQRIGRCLRIDPEDLEKMANVVDLVREGDEADEELTADQERANYLGHLAGIRPDKSK